MTRTARTRHVPLVTALLRRMIRRINDGTSVMTGIACRLGQIGVQGGARRHGCPSMANGAGNAGSIGNVARRHRPQRARPACRIHGCGRVAIRAILGCGNGDVSREGSRSFCVGTVVAAAANLGWRDMPWIPGNEVMAIVACVVAHKVVNVGRRRPVVLVGTLDMAACVGAAARYDADVIPACGKERVGPVAAVAGSGRLQARSVAGRPAGGNRSVVTCRALSRQRGPVVESCAEEGKSIEMAGLAGCVGHDVVSGFRCRHNALSQCMAAIAIPGGALEHARDVTYLASRRGMAAD